MVRQGEDTHIRCPPPVYCALASRADRLRLPFLFKGQRPLEHREGSGLRLPAAALRLHRLLVHELRPGEQRLLRLRGLVVVPVPVHRGRRMAVAVDLDPRKGADVSQPETGKAEAADERTEEARSFVRRVRTATRRKHTSEEKIRIVLEGFRREVAVSDLCRREGIKPHSYYAWTKEFMEAGKERLARDSLRDATQQEVGALRRENGELKQLMGDLSLEGYRLKKTVIPIPQDAAGTRG